MALTLLACLSSSKNLIRCSKSCWKNNERYEYLEWVRWMKEVVFSLSQLKYSFSYILASALCCLYDCSSLYYHLKRIFVIWLQYFCDWKELLVIGTIRFGSSPYFSMGFVCLNVFFLSDWTGILLKPLLLEKFHFIVGKKIQRIEIELERIRHYAKVITIQ